MCGAFCGLGASSKAQSDGPKRASIGHKGLGFKSVLEIIDSPEAYSETVSFRLGRELAQTRVAELWKELGRGSGRGVPAMRFPSEIAEVHASWVELKRRASAALSDSRSTERSSRPEGSTVAAASDASYDQRAVLEAYPLRSWSSRSQPPARSRCGIGYWSGTLVTACRYRALHRLNCLGPLPCRSTQPRGRRRGLLACN